MKNEITEMNKEQTMSSREIAGLTGKRHADVLRDIKNLVEGLDAELRSGFKLTTYKDANGQDRPLFDLDKEASMCLVSGYDANTRMKIIKRWQELEESNKKPTIANPQIAAMMLALEAVDRLEQEQLRLRAEQDRQEDRVKRIEAKQQAFEDGFKYFTVIGYSVYKALPPIDLKSAATIGKLAARISREMGLPIDKVKDIRFGYVNAYHESALDGAIQEFMS